MRRENSKASASGFVLLRGTESPKCDRTTAKLSEPALQFRLGGVVRKTRHVKNFAPLGQEGSDISSGIHRPGQDIRVVLRRL